MSTPGPRNDRFWLLDNHDERIRALEAYQPAVLKQVVGDLKDDIDELRGEIKGLRRLLVSLVVTFSAAALSFAFFALGHA